MLTLYTWTTPNGRKPAIMLEELGEPYEVRTVDFSKKQQFEPAFLNISPNNKIPALVDDAAEGGPMSIFESGAILQYLAEKTGRFLPASGPARYTALEWLHWQVGGLGPMLGQLSFFAMRAPEKVPMPIKHFSDEAERLLSVLERRLAQSEYLAGPDYTIADIAAYPWAFTFKQAFKDVLGDALAGKPAVSRWLDLVGGRPAIQRGMQVPKVQG